MAAMPFTIGRESDASTPAMCASGNCCQNADDADESVRPRDRIGYNGVIKHVGLRRFQRLGWTNRHSKAVRMAHCDAHGRATAKKQRHEIAADETGATKHGDPAGRHALSPSASTRMPQDVRGLPGAFGKAARCVDERSLNPVNCRLDLRRCGNLQRVDGGARLGWQSQKKALQSLFFGQHRLTSSECEQ